MKLKLLEIFKPVGDDLTAHRYNCCRCCKSFDDITKPKYLVLVVGVYNSSIGLVCSLECASNYERINTRIIFEIVE